MFFAKIPLLAFVLASVCVQADHIVHLKNSCPFEVQPMYKGNHTNPAALHGPKLKAGASGQFTVSEIWESGRLCGQDPKHTCLEPDGARCTLVEVNFGRPGSDGKKWWQANLSLVSGYNLPTKLGYVGGDESSCDKTFSCKSPNCLSTEAYLRGSGAASCNACISQCNTPQVGISVEWCQSGSVVPDMGQPRMTTTTTTKTKEVTSKLQTKTSTAKPTPTTKGDGNEEEPVPPGPRPTSTVTSHLTGEGQLKRCPARHFHKRNAAFKRTTHFQARRAPHWP